MILSFDQFELDADKPDLRYAGTPVKVDSMVLRLLVALVTDAGRLVTKHELLSRVWDGRKVSENVITVAMARLRRTLAREGGALEFVVNVHGQGYRFVRTVVVREAAQQAAPGQRAAPAAASGFVGRERVLDRLRASLDAVRGGRGGVCVVTGEAGIGKTRVLEVLAHEAAALGLGVAWGHCHEGADTPPLWPFAQLLRELLAHAPFALDDPRLAGALPELRRLLPELARDGDSVQARSPVADFERSGTHRMFDAVARALAAAGERAPCVLVLDDLQRADAASLALLRYLCDEIARTRVLVLATLRSEALQDTGARTTAILGHRNCVRIALDRLREADVTAYVSGLLDDTSGALARAVFDKSEGNPLFMVELSRQLLDSDQPRSELLAVPQAALELVRQRVAALDEATRGVLSCAAVIGRNFELSVLQLATDRDGPALMASLDDALATDVVIAAPDSKTAFAFGHELFRAALYDALSPAERRQWHLRVARALDQRLAAGDAIAPAQLAHQFFSALPQSDLRMTVHHCAHAATACADVYAYVDAARHVRHAREALALIDNPSQRLRMGLLLRQAMYARVDSSAEFEPLIREAIEVARKQQAGTPLAMAALMLDLHPGFPPLPGAYAALAEALSLLAPGDPLRSAVLGRLATASPLAYDGERACAQAAQALSLAQASDFLLGIHVARCAQLYLLGGPTHEVAAGEQLRALDALCREHPQRLSVAPLLLDMHRAIIAFQHGDRAAMDAALERCEQRGKRVGSRDLLWHIGRFRILARIDAAGADSVARAEPIAALRGLHQLARSEAFAGSAALGAYDRCLVFGEGAQLDAAGRTALTPDAHDPPHVWAYKLRALAAAGLHDDVRVGLGALPPERLAQLPRDRDWLGTLGALARTVLAVGADAYKAPLRALLSPHAECTAVGASFVSEGTVADLVAALR